VIVEGQINDSWCCVCQKYRHVDYIQFENPMLVERFLDYWRKTGNQRIGLLFGRYEYHKDVPLGIKAVVAAIYEPQQVGLSILTTWASECLWQ